MGRTISIRFKDTPEDQRFARQVMEGLRENMRSPFGSTIFSSCRQYRYTLWRCWGDDWQTNFCQFIGLNPSTADETQDDPTVRRCINYAKAWGYSGLCMTNIFAFRATDPQAMLVQDDPVGAENDRYLLECAKRAKIVVAAWGNHGIHRDRAAQVMSLVPNLHCLKVTGAGMPGHPLYLPKDLKPVKLAQKGENYGA